MTDEPTIQSLGGIARAKALPSARRSEIARQAGLQRWNDTLPRASHDGALHVAGIEIPCAVIEGPVRLITQSGFMRALGRARQAKGRQFYDADVNMPAFLTAKNLKPFISKDLEVTSSQVVFRLKSGRIAFGYPAELLPKVCGVFIDAEDKEALSVSQKHIADMARKLIRGLAEVGIAALVDEATGYQDVRDKRALEEILNRFLSAKQAEWAKRFPDEFYDEIFRLRKWEWERTGSRRPVQVAKDTINLVYMRMLPTLLRELESKNPKDERGRRKAKHHQFFSLDIGSPALNEHVRAVITVMKLFDTWDEFKQKIDRALPVVTRLDDLPLFGQPGETIAPVPPVVRSLPAARAAAS